MCGRQACTLAPNHLQRACQYRDRRGSNQQPRWRNGNDGNYKPSYNIGPQTRTPVLLSSKQLGLDEAEYGERVLCDMKWGLTPPWSKDGGKGFNTINCRIETINEKVTFRQPLKKGRRCVVLADGFFEWHNNAGKKQPYFIYFKDEIKKELDPLEEHDTPNQRLLTMAGLYEESKSIKSEEDPDGDGVTYTYTIITVPSSKQLNWLHDRMPAILQTEEEVGQWLDSGEIPAPEALNLLKPKDCLQWYPVSTVVNNVRNKSLDCVKKIDLTEDKKDIKPKGMMDFWVKKSPRKKSGAPTPSTIGTKPEKEDVSLKLEENLKDEETGPPPSKKIKT